MSAISPPRPRAPGWLARSMSGFTAVGVKELRGRMRGKRAFVLLTVYLALMALFAWMVLGIVETAAEQSFAGGFVASQIGQQLFVALLMLETLLVPFLAPALTASAISLEREKQTLDMLSVTPISSIGLVLGKLFSALTYVFLLIFASIPLTALVFVFGGVGPDDLARGYIVLIVTAIGFGSIGLFFSALVQRTQAATVLTYFVVFSLTMGALFVWVFLRVTEPFEQQRMDPSGQVVAAANRAPGELLFFNPFVSQADVICGTETVDGAFCSVIREFTGRSATIVTRPVPVDELPAAEPGMPGIRDGNLDDVAAPAFERARDTFWPSAMLAWIALSVVLIGLSVRLVGPRRGRRRGLRSGSRAAS